MSSPVSSPLSSPPPLSPFPFPLELAIEAPSTSGNSATVTTPNVPTSSTPLPVITISIATYQQLLGFRHSQEVNSTNNHFTLAPGSDEVTVLTTQPANPTDYDCLWIPRAVAVSTAMTQLVVPPGFAPVTSIDDDIHDIDSDEEFWADAPVSHYISTFLTATNLYQGTFQGLMVYKTRWHQNLNMDRNLQTNLKFHEKVFSLYNYMAGSKNGFMDEMRTKMAYFRGSLDITVKERPTQDNRSMVEYITNRWNVDEKITMGAHVDVMFMAVSFLILSSQLIILIHSSMISTATTSIC